MLTTTIHRDLTKYEAKLFFGLSARTLICVAAAIAVSVATAAWFWFAFGVTSEHIQLLIIAVSAPFWAMGFIRPAGMKVETFIPLWVRHNLGDPRFAYSTRERLGADAAEKGKVTKIYRKLRARRGIEAISPGEGLEDEMS